jgi:hypothetical protein
MPHLEPRLFAVGATGQRRTLVAYEVQHRAPLNPASGIGAKDILDAIVGGKHPLPEVCTMKSDGPDGGKADVIRDIVHDYRGLARQKLVEIFPSIQAEMEAQRMDAHNAATRMGVIDLPFLDLARRNIQGLSSRCRR